MSILSMSITGGVMIIAVVLLRALLLERLPKKTFLVLWGLVMLRLLVPFQISSKASIYNLVPNLTPALSPIVPAVNTPMPAFDMPYIPHIPPTTSTVASRFSPITVVWIAGIVLTLLVTALVYANSLRDMKTSLPCENMFVENWLNNVSLKRKIQVRVLDRIKTPLTYGLIHPVILLPKSMNYSNEQQLLTILTHEYIHIKRFDNLKKIMMVLTLSIHWFNPLVWVMFVLCNRDIELACDEKVLLDLGKDTRAIYALTLVELSEQGNAFSLSSGFSKNALEERIKAIMKHKKITAFTVAIVLVLIIGITTVFATSSPERNIDSLNQRNVSSFFSVEEYRKVSDLKFEGYEDLSINDYRDKVLTVIDENHLDLGNLIERMYKDDSLSEVRYTNRVFLLFKQHFSANSRRRLAA